MTKHIWDSYTAERESGYRIHGRQDNTRTYKWLAPIPHLIKREPNYPVWQDSCLMGAGGFSFLLCFWWALEWLMFIVLCTLKHLSKGDKNLISINLLEYAAMIISLAGAILVWESLPPESRLCHPVCLLWTDNTGTASWTK